ncbi:MAG: tetratricopeptide repeat protein [Deltaproteobacteria bacterium]|nr:tetratricopeptide repeat protein [Deltaproteobacteria bacterium]
MAKRAKGGGVKGPKARAQALLQAGRWAEARALCEELSRQAPADAEVHYLLGSIAGQEQRLEAAVGHLRRAVELQPEAAVAHAGLGAALKGLGRLAEAEVAFRRVVALQPTYAEAALELAQILLQEGKAAEAESTFHVALRLQPRWHEALHGLGDCLMARAQLAPAIDAYRRALKADPNHVATRFRLGSALLALGNLEEAVDHLGRAAKVAPRVAEVQRALGVALAKLGRLPEARVAYQRALKECPEDVESRVGEALILDQERDWEGAYGKIAPLLEAGVEHPGVGSVLANICRHLQRCDEAVAYLERLRVKKGLRPEQRSEVCLALGKLYDRGGAFDEAFACFREGNQLRAYDFDAKAHIATTDQLIETFTRAFFDQAPRATVASEVPLFIIGTPRSGTSLVEQILASHPDAYGAGEIEDTGIFVQELVEGRYGKGGYPDCFHHLTSRTLDRLARRYLDHLAHLAPDALRVTDKMLQNYRNAGFNALLFPRARVVHIRRDPRDVAVSIYSNSFLESVAFSGDLETIGIYCREYRRLMDHWREVLPLPMLEVEYEALVGEPERWIREIIAFAGLAWDDRCLHFHETRRTVATLSYDQVRQPMYKGSAGRWRNYERHLGPLLKALGMEDG